MLADPGKITKLLAELSGGHRDVVDQLIPLVYDQLRAIAQRQLRGERAHHTLNATAVAHEAYLKLVEQTRVNWQNRAHFYAIAAQAMRRILINYAQKRSAEKRGGDEPLVTFDEGAMLRDTRPQELLALDAALSDLEKLSERQSKVVEYRFFGGLTHEEIAEVLEVSVSTVRRDWRVARAWLSRELRSSL
ncbi:MAG: sigma-70 family RNA polymerase sigma factor [bacterium]